MSGNAMSRISGLVSRRRPADQQDAEEAVDWSLPMGAGAAPPPAAASAPAPPRARARGTGIAVQPTNSVRSATADEGIRLLKQGVGVTKYGRNGQPHTEKLVLSADERSLGWAGHVASKLMGSSKLLSPKASSAARTVMVDDVVELWVGHETHIFKRHVRQAVASGKPVAAGPHLSLSLLLKSTLPAPPAESAEDDAEGGAQGERETLDVSCEDDEQFGLCVAALRALLTEVATPNPEP